MLKRGPQGVRTPLMDFLNPGVKLVLASASPRRKELLRMSGISFRIRRTRVEENGPIPKGMDPVDWATNWAVKKALNVATHSQAEIVLGADTIVTIGGNILGKPRDRRDARRMLTILSGKWHEVITGVAIVKDGQLLAKAERTRVKFRKISADEVERYIASGEPKDKAGAYAIQGRAKAFVENIKGDYTNVVGLPLNRVLSMLSEIQAGMDNRRMHDGLKKPLKGGYSDEAL